MSARLNWWLMGALVVLLVVLQWMQPREVNWAETYRRTGKEPYGTFVTTEYLQRHVARSVVYNDRVAWRAVRDEDFPSPESATWMMIGREYAPDTAALDSLLHWVQRGGTWFLATEWVSPNVSAALDTLRTSWNPGVDTLRMVDTVFRNPAVTGLRLGMAMEGITQFDSTVWTVLAKNEHDQAVLVQRAYGSGRILFSSTPLLFTNYGFINDSLVSYPVHALSYVPRSVVIWDDYMHPASREETSLFGLFRQNTGARWAWYVVISVGLLYVVVYARRRQRAIPMLERIRNTSAEYVRTVGRLYYARHDNRNMANKLIRLFRDHVHQHLRLRTDLPHDVLVTQIAGASGAPASDVDAVLSAIAVIEDSDEPITDSELLRFNAILDTYHRKARP